MDKWQKRDLEEALISAQRENERMLANQPKPTYPGSYLPQYNEDPQDYVGRLTGLLGSQTPRQALSQLGLPILPGSSMPSQSVNMPVRSPVAPSPQSLGFPPDPPQPVAPQTGRSMSQLPGDIWAAIQGKGWQTQ